MSSSCATPRTFDCATLSIIGHALPLSTITRAALATPHCVDAGTHTDAPSAVSQTDSLQWRASSCNDRLCLTLISARPPHHKTHFLSYPENRCFSVRLRGRLSFPPLPRTDRFKRKRSFRSSPYGAITGRCTERRITTCGEYDRAARSKGVDDSTTKI